MRELENHTRRVLSAPVLLAGFLAALVVAPLAGALPAQAETTRPAQAETTRPAQAETTPAGWTAVFDDSFAGPAGSAPAEASWFYDTGSGDSFGMGEIDTATRSTRNVYLDGDGHLVLRALRAGGSWTSGRIESTRDDFMAPAGGEMEMSASIELPAAAGALGYWPAFWAVGAPKRAGGVWPQAGELDMMEDVNGWNGASQTLHDGAGSTGTGLIGCQVSACQSGFHTYSVVVSRTSPGAEFLQFLMDGRVRKTVTEASVGVTAWREAIDHGFFIILDLAVGGSYPDAMCQCTTPGAATTPGGSMKVAYVTVDEKGGNSTPVSKPVATGRSTGAGGSCLDNQDSLNTTANVIDAAACGTQPGLQWSPYTDGTLRVQGGCLGFWGATASSGAWADWYPCNGTAAQTWTRTSGGELVNPESGLCLTDPAGARAVQLDLTACTGAAAQRWGKP